MENEELNEDLEEELARKANIKPPRATKQEILEDEEDDLPMRQPSNKYPTGFGSSTLKNVLLNVAVTLAIIMAMGFFGGGTFVTKKDFTTNMTNISSTITQMTSDIAAKQNEVNTTLATIPDKINKAVADAIGNANSQTSQQISNLSNQVNNFNSSIQNNTDKVNSLSSKVDTNNTNFNQQVSDLTTKLASATQMIDSLNNKMSDMQDTMNDYDDRISKIEDNQIVIPTSTPDSITASVKTISNSLVASSNTSMTGSIRVELTNTTNQKINDVVLDVMIQTDIIAGYSSSSLSGASTIWQGQGIPWNMMDFMNTQWGLNLNAGETKVIYLTYTVTGTGFLPQYQNYGVPFQVDVDVI